MTSNELFLATVASILPDIEFSWGSMNANGKPPPTEKARVKGIQEETWRKVDELLNRACSSADGVEFVR